MGRSPCCEKGGLKKGPWTPEEDIVLVSYIQEHGPGNWRMIPANTGLSRCSKSCRLRWTNYLRPGIKRGNFTPHEDRIIIHLQALLGNRWAAIASYLPRRTDNDIKNYWNTHLKKRLNRLQTPGIASNRFAYDIPFKRSSELDRVSKGQWETRLQTNIDLAKQALQEALCSGSSPLSGLQDSEIITNSNHLSTENLSSSVYSTLNLSKLLEGWKKSSLNKKKLPSPDDIPAATSVAEYSSSCCSEGYQSHEIPYYNSEMPIACKMAGLNSSDHSEILRSISPCNSGHQGYSYQEQCSLNALNVGNFTDNHQSSPDNKLPFLLLEKWLMEETGQADQLLSSSESGIAV